VTVFSFDATCSTHDLLKAGVTEARLPGSPHRHHRVVVEADTRDEAALIAAQMVSTCWGMCTGLYDRI
jgi:hypothetical protein